MNKYAKVRPQDSGLQCLNIGQFDYVLYLSMSTITTSLFHADAYANSGCFLTCAIYSLLFAYVLSHTWDHALALAFLFHLPLIRELKGSNLGLCVSIFMILAHLGMYVSFMSRQPQLWVPIVFRPLCRHG